MITALWSGLAEQQVFFLLALVLTTLALVSFSVRYSRRRYPLRKLVALSRIKSLTQRAIEAGEPVHVALGARPLLQATPEVTQALRAASYVVHQSAALGQDSKLSTGTPEALAASWGVLDEADREIGRGGSGHRSAHFSGPGPLAFGGQVGDDVRVQSPPGLVQMGAQGAEGLLLAELAATGDTERVSGAETLDSAALLAVSADATLYGEDVHALGAYLDRAEHMGSLALLDVVRVLLIMGIIASVVLRSTGVW